jgi:hypothetical protein
VPLGMNVYAFVQFVLALVFAVFVLLKSKEWDLINIVGPVFLVVLSITTIGGLSDMRRWAFIMEIAKNITVGVLFVVSLQNTAPLWATASGALLYLGITTVWLLPFLKHAEKAKVTYAG